MAWEAAVRREPRPHSALPAAARQIERPKQSGDQRNQR